MYAQCNVDRNEYLLIKSFIDVQKDPTANSLDKQKSVHNGLEYMGCSHQLSRLLKIFIEHERDTVVVSVTGQGHFILFTPNYQLFPNRHLSQENQKKTVNSVRGSKKFRNMQQ